MKNSEKSKNTQQSTDKDVKRIKTTLKRSQQYAQSRGLDQATMDKLLADES